MAGQSYYFDPEKLGRRRFPDNKAYRADLNGRADILLSSFFDLFANNYPKSANTNLGILYKTLSREIARQQGSIETINNNKVFSDTQIEYLQQILGERLFLSDRIAPVNYNDETYRDYLIAIKDAYLKGSKKNDIENILNRFTKQQVHLKELYLEARKPNSAYTVADTHKMVLEVLVDDILASGVDLATLSAQINFFVNLVRPAHVLYDTKFIWTETFNINKIHDIIFGDLGGGCVPIYLWTPLNEKTVLAQQILVVPPPQNNLLIGVPLGLGSTLPNSVYRIASIHENELIIYTENDVKVIVEPGVDGTQIYGQSGKRILFEDLEIGQYIRLTFLIIPGDFNFYYLPPDLVDNYGSRFYKDVYRKPAFQEFVKKQMDAQGRYPLQIRSTPTTLCDRWVQDALQPMYEDLRKDCSETPEKAKSYTITLSEHMWSPRFSWENIQGASLGREKTGDIFTFEMPYAPLTDGSGHQATPASIKVWKDSTAIFGSILSVDSSSATINLQNTTAYWDASGYGTPKIGQDIEFGYHYGALDTTATTAYVFGISQWQLPNVPVSNGNGSNTLALPSDLTISVDGTKISDAVVSLNPILGHVTLQSEKDFWLASELARAPGPGDQIKIDYYQSGTTTYSMLWDDIARNFDDSMTFDGAEGTTDPTRAPAPKFFPLEIGYKFRTDLLHHASVLNSPDTLQLNNYQKPSKRASIINRQDTLNHYNYFFSPEHLEDTDPQIELNDLYISKATPPAVIKLHQGTPTFQQTYAYQPNLIYQRKLQDIRKHHHPLMYCDLLLKKFYSGDASIPLTSICDSARYSFKVRFRENLNKLQECDSWILFDTAVTSMQMVTIPSTKKGVINLRVPSKKLRSNFILRETAPTNITPNTYSTYIPIGTPQTIFQLPSTIVYRSGSEAIDFPSLPVVKDYSTLATADDVIVALRGQQVAGLIKNFDPVTGYVEIYDLDNYTVNDYIQLTQRDIDVGFVSLTSVPIRPELTTMGIYKGSVQEYGVDFFVINDLLYWTGTPLSGRLAAGDILRVNYPVYALQDTTISFTYNIRSIANALIMDESRSRVFDFIHVFPGLCFDGFAHTLHVQFKEYVNFLSDYSTGIKFTYFNKDTYQIEEHVFTGPVFESYCAQEDEISSPDTFPNALVRIKNPLSQTDPFHLTSNYQYLDQPAIRIRKKTIQELLPDRTFKTTKVVEALPV